MDDVLGKEYLDNPFRPLAAAWCKLMRRAQAWKKAQFQDDADDIQMFFDGCKDDFWKSDYARGPRGYMGGDAKVAPPDFQMLVMKVAEAVQIFGPSLYANNPTIAVSPKRYTEVAPQTLGIDPASLQASPPGPNGEPGQPTPQLLYWQQQQNQRQSAFAKRESYANIFRDILNYEQVELDKQSHMRRIIDEALIAGLGIGWTELIEFPGSDRKLVGSFYEPVKNLLLDPDADSWETLQWVARERTMPYWEAEDMFGYDRGALQHYCKTESVAQQEMAKESEDASGTKRASGKTNDLITFWEIYSKMGIGDRLKGVPNEVEQGPWADIFPEHCKLCVAEHIPFPLNLPPSILKLPKDDVKAKAAWPIPFYKDNQWPCVPVAFHPVPGQVWPQSHFKPALGEIHLLSWCFSCLANKVRTSCGTWMVGLAAAKDQLEAKIEESGDNKVLWLQDAYDVKDASKLLSFIQAPEFHADLWKFLQAMLLEIDKRLGTAEVLYGMSSGAKDRSATETDLKFKSASTRISDMGRAIESGLSRMCRNEAIANWAIVTGKDVFEVLGPEAAYVYDTQIKTMPAESICREFMFEIIAGSTRKMNKQARAELMNEAMTILGPALQTFAGMGIFNPWNALVVDWAKANDIDNPERYVAEPPPQQPDPKQEAEMAKLQGEMQMQQVEGQQKQESHQLEIQKALFEMEAKKQELALKAQEAQMKMAMEMEKHRLQMEMEKQKCQLEIQLEREKAQASLQVESAKASQQIQLAEVQGQQQVALEERKAETQLAVEEKKAEASMKQQDAMTKAKVQQTKDVGKAQVATAKAKAAATPKKTGEKK